MKCSEAGPHKPLVGVRIHPRPVLRSKYLKETKVLLEIHKLIHT